VTLAHTLIIDNSFLGWTQNTSHTEQFRNQRQPNQFFRISPPKSLAAVFKCCMMWLFITIYTTLCVLGDFFTFVSDVTKLVLYTNF
jgi:hypothetical protein